MKFFIFCFSFLILQNVMASGQEENMFYHDRRAMLGTFVEVISSDKEAIKIAFDEIKRLQAILSKFDDSSDIYKLNKERKTRTHLETIEIIEKAKYFYQISDAAFDITAEKTKISKGLDAIIIDKDTQTIELKNPALNIDLGGLACGYIVDKAISAVKNKGVDAMLINAGGDIYCLGKKSSNAPWTVGVQNPYLEKDVLKTVELENKAITTSGTYNQPRHIINPKTGKPVESDLASVSVIAPDCITADALATAIFVLGKNKGLKLIKKLKDVDAYIYTKKDIIQLMR